MSNIKNIFDSFKEFIWDIIGYLIPGSYLLILLAAFINEDLFISLDFHSTKSDLEVLVWLILSYLLGHVIYGYSFFKEGLKGNKSYTKTLEKSITHRRAYIWSKQLLAEKFKSKNIQEDFSEASVRDLRSMVMSYIPEADQKIYTFTFRADISNNILNMSLLIGVAGLIFSILQIQISDLSIFNSGFKYYLMYIILILISGLLKKTRDRFYSISLSVPFSIFASKELD